MIEDEDGDSLGRVAGRLKKLKRHAAEVEAAPLLLALESILGLGRLGAFIADEVGSVRQAPQIVLLEKHRAPQKKMRRGAGRRASKKPDRQAPASYTQPEGHEKLFPGK